MSDNLDPAAYEEAVANSIAAGLTPVRTEGLYDGSPVIVYRLTDRPEEGEIVSRRHDYGDSSEVEFTVGLYTYTGEWELAEEYGLDADALGDTCWDLEAFTYRRMVQDNIVF